MTLQIGEYGAPPFEQRETARWSADLAVLPGVTRQGMRATPRFRVAELWSLPFVYRWEADGKPLLLAVLPQGWHMRHVGVSIRAPAWCGRP